MISRSQAVRFLQQASFGGTPDEVAALESSNIETWITEQLARPQTVSHLARTESVPGQNVQHSIWQGYLSEPDQLRKRWSYALSQIFVVGVRGIGNSYIAAYADILEQHGFGTYRNLIEKITYSTAMSKWLTYDGNRRAGAYRNNVPDENYAREIMQLFSIGLWQLNPDGTRTLDSNGEPIPAYTEDDVRGLARVFTGLRSVPLNGVFLDAAVPLDPDSQFAFYDHEIGEKRFLDTVIPARPDRGSAEPSITAALDALAAHPNTGPFLSRQLIQRLVTSNPSAAYVGRVAQVFADDGNGVRGNLGAVARASLVDPEARSTPGTEAGKLREPMLRFTTLTRALGVGSTGTPWPLRWTSDPATELGQTFYDSPSVFNFYRPGYVPPQTELAERGLTGPEFQIHDESSSIGWVNYTMRFIADAPQYYFLAHQPGQFTTRPTFDLDELVQFMAADVVSASNAGMLVDELIKRVCPDGLEPRFRSLAIDAVIGTVEPNYDLEDGNELQRRSSVHRDRVAAALMIIAVSPDFLHER